MRHHRTARAPGRAGVPGRAWHGVAWRAGDAARMARFQCRLMTRWECAGALISAAGAFCVALFALMPMPGFARQWSLCQWSLVCAGGAVAFAVARLRRTWRGHGTGAGRR